jgi:hypothetical protein
MSGVTAVGPTDVPRRCLGIRIRRIEGTLVVGVEDRALELSDSAELIFTSLDGRRTVADVAGLLAAEYGIEAEEALVDVAEFLTDLRAMDIVSW